jgi:hypothetical protein
VCEGKRAGARRAIENNKDAGVGVGEGEGGERRRRGRAPRRRRRRPLISSSFVPTHGATRTQREHTACPFNSVIEPPPNPRRYNPPTTADSRAGEGVTVEEKTALKGPARQGEDARPHTPAPEPQLLSHPRSRVPAALLGHRKARAKGPKSDVQSDQRNATHTDSPPAPLSLSLSGAHLAPPSSQTATATLSNQPKHGTATDGALHRVPGARRRGRRGARR